MANCTPKNRLSNLFPQTLSDVDNLVSQFLGPVAQSHGLAKWQAPASLWETEDRLHLEIDAPGVSRENVDITLDAGVLSVKLERTRPADRQYWHNERLFGKVERSVTLPETVDPDSIEAELNDGLLSISIAKTPQSQPRKVDLK